MEGYAQSRMHSLELLPRVLGALAGGQLCCPQHKKKQKLCRRRYLPSPVPRTSGTHAQVQPFSYVGYSVVHCT